MAILNRNKESAPRPSVDNTSDEPVIEKKKPAVKKGNKETEFKATERLNLKVNPPDLEKLKLITRFEGGTLYGKFNKIIEFYLENNYEDRDKKIIKRILENGNE